jgi:hypothetical protein
MVLALSIHLLVVPVTPCPTAMRLMVHVSHSAAAASMQTIALSFANSAKVVARTVLLALLVRFVPTVLLSALRH